MNINREWGKETQPSVELLEFAKGAGLQVAQIVCAEPDLSDMISFYSAVQFLPRVGDSIGLENGRIGIVQRVHFNIDRSGHQMILRANVYVKMNL